MSDASEVMQVIKDMLISVGFTDEIDAHANLFMLKINNLAFDMYVKGLPQTAADLVFSELISRTKDEQRLQFMTELLSRNENQHYLQTASQQVAEEFSAIVNREA